MGSKPVGYRRQRDGCGLRKRWLWVSTRWTEGSVPDTSLRLFGILIAQIHPSQSNNGRCEPRRGVKTDELRLILQIVIGTECGLTDLRSGIVPRRVRLWIGGTQ